MRTFRVGSLLFFGASLVALGFACTAFNDAVVREDDGGVVKPPDGSTPDGGDSCASSQLPRPPNSAADDGTITFYAVLRSMKFLADAGPVAFSYDLDGKCTCPERETCIPLDSGKGPRCDFDGGVDNAGGALIANGSFLGFTLSNFEAQVQEGIDEGENGIIVGVEGYNGKPDDPRVTVSIYRSLGPRDGSGNPKKPAFLPDEEWTRLTVDVDPATRPSSSTAYVTGGTLVALLQTSYLPFKDSYVQLRQGRVVARIEDVGGGRYALRDGKLVGRWTTKSMMQNMIRIVPPANGGKRICETEGGLLAFENLGVKREICNAADIAADFDDGTTACDALSVGAGFEAVPTAIGETVPPPVSDVCEGVSISDCAR